MTTARSLLFVPANGEHKIEKAFAGAADGVILDLEDAVAVSQKAAARDTLAATLAAMRGRKPAYVRVNAVSTPYCFRDLMALPLRDLAGVLVPKVESAEEAWTVDWMLLQLEAEQGVGPRSVPVVAMIETARGLTRIDAIAGATPRITRIAWGAVDFAHDTNAALGDRAATEQAHFALVRASRNAGLEAPIDAPGIDFSDPERLRADAQRARAMGFGGKLCIHPAQLAVVHEVFRPTADEIARAQRIVAAFDAAEAAGSAAIAVDGQMIDYPVVLRARRVLEAAASVAGG
ncbi:MAG: CoA ester lyase [Burkholderiales bacterium]